MLELRRLEVILLVLPAVMIYTIYTDVRTTHLFSWVISLSQLNGLSLWTLCQKEIYPVLPLDINGMDPKFGLDFHCQATFLALPAHCRKKAFQPRMLLLPA